MEHRGYVLATGSGEHAHKLLKWFERLTGFKVELHSIHIDEIRSEGSKMVGVVPLPRRCSLVVVLQNPSETLNIMRRDLFPELQVGVWDTELLLVIPFAVTRLPEFDGIFLFHSPVRVYLERQRSLAGFLVLIREGCTVRVFCFFQLAFDPGEETLRGSAHFDLRCPNKGLRLQRGLHERVSTKSWDLILFGNLRSIGNYRILHYGRVHRG